MAFQLRNRRNVQNRRNLPKFKVKLAASESASEQKPALNYQKLTPYHVFKNTLPLLYTSFLKEPLRQEDYVFRKGKSCL